MSTYYIRCSDGNVLKDLSPADLQLLKDIIPVLLEYDHCQAMKCDSERVLCMGPAWNTDTEADEWLHEAEAKEPEIAAFQALKSG
jgi:hypothetical protein